MCSKGSETQKNLVRAYILETSARTRYDIMSKVAKKEGYVHMAKIWEETAQQEFQHAKLLYENFAGSDVMCIPKEAPPLPKIGNTRENLIASLDGELYEVEKNLP